MRQTAVEWLMEEMSRVYIFDQTDFDLFKRAKEIERQQIEETWYDCKLSIICKEPTTADQYYNKTYKK
jgi:hypothetical protein